MEGGREGGKGERGMEGATDGGTEGEREEGGREGGGGKGRDGEGRGKVSERAALCLASEDLLTPRPLLIILKGLVLPHIKLVQPQPLLCF